MIENTSKAPLNFSPLECTYLGKIRFDIISAESEKMKLISGHLVLLFSVILTACRGPGALSIYSTHGTPKVAT